MFDIKKTLDKVLRGVIAGGVSVASAFIAKHIAGFELSPEQQGALVAGAFGVISGLTNLLKHKFPKFFFWL